MKTALPIWSILSRVTFTFVSTLVLFSGCAMLENSDPDSADKAKGSTKIYEVIEGTPVKVAAASHLSELARIIATDTIESAAKSMKPNAPAPRSVIVAPNYLVEDGRQTLGGMRFTELLENTIEAQFPGLPIEEFSARGVTRASWLLVTAIQMAQPQPGPRLSRQLMVCAVLIELRTQKMLSKQIRVVPVGMVNLVPTTFYRELPIEYSWPEHPVRADICQTTLPTKQRRPAMIESLQATAQFETAKRAYNQRAYREASKQFSELKKNFKSDGKRGEARQLMADLGLYLSFWRRNRIATSRNIRNKIVGRLLSSQQDIGLNLALSPISTDQMAEAKLDSVRRTWIWSIGSYLSKNKRCARLSGSARSRLNGSKTGESAGLAHAKWAHTLIEQWHQRWAKKIQVVATTEPLRHNRLATGDVRDEWDRLVHIQETRCS